MDNVEYEKLNFKSGLEIHQQLDSSKLFCDCPSVLRSDEPDFVIKRKLHAVRGESGKIDAAVEHEVEKNKQFFYQGYDTTCLVELDEEPPHRINQDALKIAVQISLLLNCKVFPLTQIMRKTVVDGSNTSGFQRTVMIARNGFLETSQGRVAIEGIFLEEDSARIVKSELNSKIFKLDRLGIPLVEIATAPDIKNAEHAKETALEIGNILRSCRVKRGIGTIRQDVNISIQGKNRVEIKGFQNPKIMIKTVENEVERQKKLLKENKLIKAEVRNVLPDATTKFLRPMPGEARMYPETDLPLLKISRDFINYAKKSLPKLKSESKEELEQKGLSQEMIKLLFKQNKIDEFKVLMEILDKPKLISKLLCLFPKEIAKKEKKDSKEVYERLKDSFENILYSLKKKIIFENQIKTILQKILKGETFNQAILFKKSESNVLEEKILKLIQEKPGLSEKAYMGLLMKEFKGQVDGKEAMELIRKHL